MTEAQAQASATQSAEASTPATADAARLQALARSLGLPMPPQAEPRPSRGAAPSGTAVAAAQGGTSAQFPTAAHGPAGQAAQPLGADAGSAPASSTTTEPAAARPTSPPTAAVDAATSSPTAAFAPLAPSASALPTQSWPDAPLGAQSSGAPALETAVTPSLQSVTPSLQSVTPSLQSVTPSLQSVTSSPQSVTSALQSVTPSAQGVTPALQSVTPSAQGVTPALQSVTPSAQGVTPALQSVTPSAPLPQLLDLAPAATPELGETLSDAQRPLLPAVTLANDAAAPPNAVADAQPMQPIGSPSAAAVAAADAPRFSPPEAEVHTPASLSQGGGLPNAAIEVPIAQSSRRFLQPLVGIDPGSVTIFEAPVGAEHTRDADAVTVGDQVLLAAGNAGESPEALGLLAHELTHVAQARDVMPPIAEAPTTQDEEAMARRVESRVIATSAASAGPFADAAPPPVRGESPNSLAAAGLHPPAADAAAQPAAETPPAWPTPVRDPRTDPWGGLPAPWEPLPDWMTAPLPLMTRADIDNGLYHGNFDTNGSSNGNGSANYGGGGGDSGNTGNTGGGNTGGGDSGANSGGSSGGGSAGGGGAQFAEATRSLEAPATTAAGAAETTPPAPPDLDALAHQVYTILKRRLSAERRRLN
jgi:hypothetical protein